MMKEGRKEGRLVPLEGAFERRSTSGSFYYQRICCMQVGWHIIQCQQLSHEALGQTHEELIEERQLDFHV